MAAVQRVEGVVSEVVDGKAVLIDTTGKELITLNRVGTLVWDAIDGRREPAALVEFLATQFADVPKDRLESDIRRFVSDLTAAGLVTGAS